MLIKINNPQLRGFLAWISAFAAVDGGLLWIGGFSDFYVITAELLFVVYAAGTALLWFNPLGSVAKPGFVFLGLVLIKLILFGLFLLIWKKYVGLTPLDLGLFFGAYALQSGLQVWAVRKQLDGSA